MDSSSGEAENSSSPGTALLPQPNVIEPSDLVPLYSHDLSSISLSRNTSTTHESFQHIPGNEETTELIDVSSEDENSSSSEVNTLPQPLSEPSDSPSSQLDTGILRSTNQQSEGSPGSVTSPKKRKSQETKSKPDFLQSTSEQSAADTSVKRKKSEDTSAASGVLPGTIGKLDKPTVREISAKKQKTRR